jgi:exoribonuclease R
MDFVLDAQGEILEDTIKYSNVLIKIAHNYAYEEGNLLDDERYKLLLDISKRSNSQILNSHDVVAHWMVFMNTQIGKMLLTNKNGIFRSVNYVNPVTNNELSKTLDEETVRVIHMWNNTIGQYVAYDEDSKIEHEIMKTKSYVHITSPIRRLVDLLNQMIMFDMNGMIMNMSSDAKAFLQKWLNELDYVNKSMRSIRKVQTDCALLDRCFNDASIMERHYKGVVFDKVTRENGYVNYMVYLKELKLLSRVNIMVDMDNFVEKTFKIYLFEDEDKTKKKIRLQLVL